MERKGAGKQTGSCVDPLWDQPFTEDVPSSARRYSQGSEGTASRRSTPLTPQEFELLSNSNPFKQDIAEKYGLAYPAITTRSRTRDVLQKTRGVCQVDDVASCDVEDFVDLGVEDDYRKATREETQSVFVALSQFLLRNRQSIDESIQKLENTDEFLSRRSEKSDAPSIKSEWVGNDEVWEYDGKKKPTNNVAPSNVNDEPVGIDEIFKLDRAEAHIVHLDTDKDNRSQDRSPDIFSNTPRFLRSDTYDVQYKNETTLRSSSSSSSSWSRAGQDATSLYSPSEDPYSAIRDEDMFRRSSASTSEDDMQLFCKDKPSGVSTVSPRSFEIVELPASTTKESLSSINSNLDPFLKVAETEGRIESVYKNQLYPGEQLSSSGISKDESFLNFEDSFSDYISLPNEPALGYGSTDKGELVDSLRETGQTLVEFTPKEEICSELKGKLMKHTQEELDKSTSTYISPEFGRTIRVQEVESEDVGHLHDSFASPFQECGFESAVTAKEDRVDSGSLDLPSEVQHGEATNMETDVFSSSFYAAFSTTVSSLEDMEEAGAASGTDEKIVTPVTDEDKYEEGKSSGAGDNDYDSVFGSEANENRDGSMEVKDADAWDVFQIPGIEASDFETNPPSECDDPFRCISKDILLQKKFKVSDDSAESSRGSVSRESMKVNLSQDSSILDQLEDFPMSVSTSQQPSETGLHRHFDLVTQLDPLTECTSTDSVMVHCSSDSLDTAIQYTANTHPESSTKRPANACIHQPHSDITTLTTEKQSRRSSLPMMDIVNQGGGTPVLTTSQSVDIEDQRPRRSSLPSGTAKDKDACTSNTAYIKEDAEPIRSDPFESQTKNMPLYEKRIPRKEKIPKEPDQHAKKTEYFPHLSNAFPASVSKLVNAISDQVFQATVSTFASVPPTALRLSETSTVTTDVKQDPEASISRARLADSDTENVESPTQSAAFTEFIRSRLQKPLMAISKFAPKISESADKKTKHIHIEASFMPDQQSTAPIVTQPGGRVVNNEHHLESKRAEETNASFRDRLLNMRLPKTTSPELPERSGFLEKNTKANPIVNIHIPPDLVPYEETYTEALQSLPESSFDSLTLPSEADLKNAAKEDDLSVLVENDDGLAAEINMDTSIKLQEVDTQVLTTHVDVVQRSDSESPLIEESTVSVVDEVVRMDVNKATTAEAVSNADSISTDSDGGDIDAIVQEYKEEASDSDEADIDHIVMEFKKENPAEDNASLGGSEDGSHRSAAFNKFSRVLNKMQSVTKYMSKKKGDQNSKDHDERHRASIFSLHRRHTERYSHDEGIEDTTPQPQEETGEDAIELLSKAAEVFKEQTTKKKRATTSSIWRSKTIHAENVAIDDDNEYDLVSRAAVLFKGFKCKKPGDIDSSLPKSEGEKSTVDLSEVGKSIDLSKSQTSEIANVDTELTRNDYISVMTPGDLDNGDFQESQVRNLTLQLESRDKYVVGDEILRPSTESDTPEVVDTIDSLTRSEDHADSDLSKLDDSGFESINRHLNEQVVLSDATESPFGDLMEDIIPPSYLQKDPVLEPANYILDREVEHLSADTETPLEPLQTPLQPLQTPLALDISQETAAKTIGSDDRFQQKLVEYALDSKDNSENKSVDVTLFYDDRSEQKTNDKKDNEIDNFKEDVATQQETIPSKILKSQIEENKEETTNQSDIRADKTIDNTTGEIKRDKGDQLDSRADNVINIKDAEPKEDKINQPDQRTEKVMEMAFDKVSSTKETANEVTVVFTPESCASDSTVESPPASASLNECTCDLILSTGYDETKATRKADTAVTVGNEVTENKSNSDQREKTNGKLEEIAKEISALEAAGLEQATGRPSVETLELRAPEYQRLSSESSEGPPDAHSLTVNVPESPDNMKNLEDAASFSLCCGGNFKINLNCTAMVKKPERRPSSVVIKDKRCAMTEEEKLFPLEVSSGYRDGPDTGTDRTDLKARHEDSVKERVQVKMIQDLKVNEHERNRNFAGSREELLEEGSLKQVPAEELKSEPQEIAEQEGNDVQQGLKEQVSDVGQVDKEEGEKGDELQRDKRIVKRKSMIEEMGANKKAVNIFESVLDELVKKQGKEDPRKKEAEAPRDGETSAQSKRFARVISDSDFYENFGEGGEIMQKDKDEVVSPADDTKTRDVEESSETADQVPCAGKPVTEVVARSHPTPNISMQQSIDMYDNIMFPESAPPLPKRSPRQNANGYRVEDKSNLDSRYANGTRSSFSSVVSDGAAEAYNHTRRHHARTKWVSSTPHLPATERSEQIPSNRTNSYPYLPGSEGDTPSQFASSNAASASSFQSDSICWGNYARIEDVQEKRSYDSESSSGLVIPGVGRESTLSDISGAYIFGEYATVKDDINRGKLQQSADGHNQRNNAFQFRHFPAAMEDSHYQNVRVITAQPSGTRYRVIPSQLDVHEDMAPGFENYAVIGQPMQSKSVQFSAPTTPVGVIKVHCASQTSSESLAGLVRNDASDILEGLPVFEYTLGATQSTNSLLSDTTDNSPVTRHSDNRQPDLTRQTASLDRRKFNKDIPRKKATKVTFSRDEVLTEVIDGIKKSEGADSNGRGLRGMATSTLSSLGGGVREFARIFHVPFQCCRSGRRAKPKVSTMSAMFRLCSCSSFPADRLSRHGVWKSLSISSSNLI